MIFVEPEIDFSDALLGLDGVRRDEIQKQRSATNRLCKFIVPGGTGADAFIPPDFKSSVLQRADFGVDKVRIRVGIRDENIRFVPIVGR